MYPNMYKLALKLTIENSHQSASPRYNILLVTMRPAVIFYKFTNMLP